MQFIVALHPSYFEQILLLCNYFGCTRVILMTDCMLIVYQVFTKFWFPWEKYTYMAINMNLLTESFYYLQITCPLFNPCNAFLSWTPYQPCSIKLLLGVHIHSVCLARISMTFELTGNTFALLLVDVACAFGMVGHVQQSVRRMAKLWWRKWVRFWTPHRVWGYGRFLRWPFIASLALLSHTHRSLCGVVAVFWFNVFTFVFALVF